MKQMLVEMAAKDVFNKNLVILRKILKEAEDKAKEFKIDVYSDKCKAFLYVEEEK